MKEASFHNPRYWRMRAEVTRVLAVDMQHLEAKNVMLDKNHDYGEAWREMSQESFVDLILMKLLRVRQILNNDVQTLISEGIDANLTDIINYSIFALIGIAEGRHAA